VDARAVPDVRSAGWRRTAVIPILLAVLVAAGATWFQVVRTIRDPAPLSIPDRPPIAGIVWSNRVFIHERALKRWFETRGLSYAVWARNHPRAVELLRGRPQVTGRSASAAAKTPSPRSKPPQAAPKPPPKPQHVAKPRPTAQPKAQPQPQAKPQSKPQPRPQPRPRPQPAPAAAPARANPSSGGFRAAPIERDPVPSREFGLAAVVFFVAVLLAASAVFLAARRALPVVLDRLQRVAPRPRSIGPHVRALSGGIREALRCQKPS
jgi:hypothetical protein